MQSKITAGINAKTGQPEILVAPEIWKYSQSVTTDEAITASDAAVALRIARSE